MKKAAFAGGCFWCMQPVFQKRDGFISVMSGYAGGEKANPTYEEVSTGTTGHREAVEVTYDPTRVSYTDILDVFWENIDPTDEGGQFSDRGSQYKTAIFYHDDDERHLAEKSKETFGRSERFNKPIATEIIKAPRFYPAEDYHQNYHEKNPTRYNLYRAGSGRDSYLKKVWGKLTQKESKRKLTP